MKTKSLIIFLLGISLNCFSQYDFKKGFIVMGTDTIQGFLDYTNPNTNSNYCFFKKDTLDDVKEYTPAEIEAYGINNSRLFVKKTITVENSLHTVFLEYLVDGIVDLFYCRLSNTDFYFIEKDGNLYPLTNDNVIVELRGYQMTKKSNNYVGILNWLMSDAEEMRSEIYSSKLNHTSLINLSKDYHNMVCKDQECIVYFKKQKSKNDTKWYVTAGVVADYVAGVIDMDVSLIELSSLVTKEFGFQTRTKMISNYVTTNTNAQFNSFISGFAPGLFLNINRNSRYSFEVQVKYQYLKNSEIKINKIQIPLLMTYDLLRYKKVIPFVIVGFSNDFYTGFKGTSPFYANYEFLTDINYDYANYEIIPVYSPRVINYKEDQIINKKYHPALMTGLGLSYELPNHKKVKLEIIGSHKHIKNDAYVGIHSETEFTNFAFSCKYEL